MNRVAAKYRVWSVFMFIYGSFCILGTISVFSNILMQIRNLNSDNLFGSMYYDYYLRQIWRLSFAFLIFAFSSFLNIHGGILLRLKKINGKGFPVFYAVMSVLGAFGLFLLVLVSIFFSTSSFISAIVYAIMFMPGCILTAVMMVSKISQKEPVRQPNTNTREGTIRFLSGEYVESDIKLIPGQRLMLGSDVTQVNLVLHSAKISPYHVVIEYEGDTGCFLVTDFSATGTCVNGERLNIGVPCRVNPNSYVVLADGEIQMLII